MRKVWILFLALCLLLSVGAFASSDMPDTSMGGRAAMPAPDNSTRAMDLLGGRSAVYFEYGENGYTAAKDDSGLYETMGIDGLEAPVRGTLYAMDGVYISCAAEDWDPESGIGNSGIVINCRTDDSTPFLLGGDEELYDAPNGERYNSIIRMDVSPEEETAPQGTTDTAPGVALAFNGPSIELKNVYVESTGDSRPTVFIPSSTRDKNVSQMSELTLVDSYVRNFTTRGTLLMGGDVYVLKSSVIANNRGALVFDNTAADMYVVDSDVESLDPRGYSVYDAAGCTERFYGIRAVAGGGTITVCRDAVLYVDGLDRVPAELSARYDGAQDLTEPSVTEDGRSFIGGGYSALMIHADMASAEMQAQAYLTDTVLTTLPEEAVFYNGDTVGGETEAETYAAEGPVGYLQWQELAGACALIRSHSGKLVFDNCELRSRTGVAVRTAFYYDAMASGVYPIDGVEYAGDEIVFANMSVEGDVIHDDYMRKMELSLENATLVGAVSSGTCGSWNAKYDAIDMAGLTSAGVDTSGSDEMSIRGSFVYNDSYDTVWGVRMHMDADSAWMVTGQSNLYSFSMEDGAAVTAPEGKKLAIFVDCGMDGNAEAYDTSVGMEIEEFTPGVEYSGVVIQVVDAGVSGEISADDAIEGVHALGFVDVDGSKTRAVAVEYAVDLTGARVSADTFEVEDYGMSLASNEMEMGKNAGAVTAVYINDEPAVSETGGSGSGRYVILEVNTDYQVSRFARSYAITMAAGVKQVLPIEADACTITPGTEEKINFEERAYIGYDPMSGMDRAPEYYNYALDGTYTIEGLDGYELHTIENGTAFHATHCFDEANGEYWDFDLPYALYVPEDYDPDRSYALVLHIHDAGSMSSDPMLTLTEAQGPSNYASEAFQQLAKDQGLGGAIVVCPAIEEFFYMDEEHPAYELRMARDNYTLSCGCPAIWELMDYLTDTYSIDMDRIYGSGQSMGGMTVMAMAAQRDNYFAAILPMSCKWGSNFNKDYEFAGAAYFNAPADGEFIWNVDSDGNLCDYNNWFYLISDDNMLYLNTDGVSEYMLPYKDLCGVEVEEAAMVLNADTTEEARNEVVRELISRESPLGIYQVTMTGNVGHMSAWFYGHGTFACYEWLLSQTRQAEMERVKLDLDKPFELAEEQSTASDHLYSGSGEMSVYYPTGKFGAGTIGYNSACSVLGSSERLEPGWTPEG